jgi:hypothetical protein
MEERLEKDYQNENIFHFFIQKSLKSKNIRSGIKIATIQVPVMYRRWKSSDQPKVEQVPGTSIRQRSGHQKRQTGQGIL